jgi:hypothetical protein
LKDYIVAPQGDEPECSELSVEKGGSAKATLPKDYPRSQVRFAILLVNLKPPRLLLLSAPYAPEDLQN